MALAVGTRFGPYEIHSLIGAGGMGEVYRARDTQLQRDVALKILPSELALDPERLARFDREAQALAALNHPHIAQVYGFVREGDIRAIVMELVEGTTLAGRIARGPVPIDEALPVATQLADALEYAHERGIVHRDLKPANVKLTPDGAVKVLDFGLAKVLAGDASAQVDLLANSPTMTSPAMSRVGVILGTAAYMSPEQARGAAVDKRTDIWAFGVVLFEMLTGKSCFAGDTITDVLAGVVKSEPDWAALPAGTPSRVRDVLHRCLAKDRKKRLRDIGDAKLNLDGADATTVAMSPAPRSSRGGWIAATAASVIALVFAALWWRASPITQPAIWRGDVVGGPTASIDPTLSPDGQLLAFHAMVDGMTQLALMKPQTGSWEQRTRDRTRGVLLNLAWSVDSSRIYFDRFLDVPRGIFSVPVFGGEERPEMADAIMPLALRDGTLLAARLNDSGRFQMVHYFPESGRSNMLPALLWSNINPSMKLSHDGKTVVYVGRPLDQAAGAANDDHIYAMDLASGKSRRIAPRAAIALQKTWLMPVSVSADDGAVLFAQPLGSLFAVMTAPIDGGPLLETLFTTRYMPRAIDVARDETVYLDQIAPKVEMWLYSPGSRELTRLPAPYTDEKMPYALALPDGRVVYSARVAGRSRVMVASVAGFDPMPIVEIDDEMGAPMAMAGPDRLAVTYGAESTQTIALVSLSERRIVRKLGGIDARDIDALAATPDGRTLFYSAAGTVWAVDVETVTRRRLCAGSGVAASPDGRSVVVAVTTPTGVRLARESVAGGAEEPIPLPPGVRIVNELAPNAVAPDGRILVRLAKTDSWFWPAAVIDARNGHMEVLPDAALADMTKSGWMPDGRVLTMASYLNASIWRYQREAR